MNKDEMKSKISMALKDPILQQGFEIICKENAELKKELNAMEADRNECCRLLNLAKLRLDDAKELIEDMYYRLPASLSDYYKDVMERARQFLSEVEK